MAPALPSPYPAYLPLVPSTFTQ
ncbi:hypothetical protein CGRA01v4_11673 [Colletotrichum graminicola]|nr:hypothetical protein CGRA01v4_11673 [Colletotrichum graminicola]